VHGVVLSEGESRALLNNFMKLADLILEALDDLARLLLLGLGLLNELPALLNLTSENCNGVRVFLGKLNSPLDSSCVLEDGVVKFLAPRRKYYNRYNNSYLLTNLFSLSYEVFNARWSFSYSLRNFSMDWSPTSSWRTS